MKANAIFDRILDVLTFAAGVFVIFMLLSVLTEVAMRYFLNRPQLWVVETTEVLLPVVVFLATTWLLKSEGHVKVDIVVVLLNSRTQGILNTVTSVLGAIMCLFLGAYGILVAREAFQRGIIVHGVLNFPKAPFLAVIALGFILLSIQFMRRTHNYFRIWRGTGEPGTKPRQDLSL